MKRKSARDIVYQNRQTDKLKKTRREFSFKSPTSLPVGLPEGEPVGVALGDDF